jgi:hypothetical protein
LTSSGRKNIIGLYKINILYNLREASCEKMSCDPFQEAPPIIREFLGYIGTIKGKSPKTVSEYYLDLRTFFRYMKLKRGLVPKDVDFEQIKIDDIDLDFIKTIDLNTSL